MRAERAPARCLDITRLLSRAGRLPTGVDRVESAYLQYLIADSVPCFGLVRTGLGYLILDRAGLVAFANREWNGVWGLSRLSRKRSPEGRAALTLLRRLAVARCRPKGLKKAMHQACTGRAPGVHYLNVGHSNVDPAMLADLGAAGIRRSVLIHDTIPLDHPEFQRPESVTRFRRLLDAALTGADRIITSTEVVAADIRRHAGARDVPPVTVAPLGVEPARPCARVDRPPSPYFVTVGTIEPRKNHRLLLDVWDRLGPEAPRLVICGGRGWRNEDVFARLDRGVPGVIERPGLRDDEIAGLLAGARGALFPSLAEGFGLPPVEAAALGVPVLCSDLPVTREVLGDIPVYLNGADGYQWENTIRQWAGTTDPIRPGMIDPPNWTAHFNRVLGESV